MRKILNLTIIFYFGFSLDTSLANNAEGLSFKLASIIEKLSTEYQSRLDVSILKNRDLSFFHEKLAAIISEHQNLSFSQVDDKEYKYKISRLSTGTKLDKRLAIKIREFSNKDPDITIKYNSASLGEIMTFFPLDEIKNLKLEQDVYGKYTKFSLSISKDLDEIPSIHSMYDLKNIFDDNILLKNIADDIPLVSKESYVFRDKGFEIDDGETKIKLTLDLYFNSYDSLEEMDFSNLISGELSFRAKLDKKPETHLAVKIFKALAPFELYSDKYSIKTPEQYY